ncbi:MAG: YitT family protein [Candidatus Hydrogenedentes bacterium]|nr:YitT family protein [Candidatus Hydrogenedentota bacterium]
MMKKAVGFFYQSLLLAVGSLLCAVAVRSMIMPHDFLARGLTGFALLIFYKWPVLPIGLLYLLINIPVFALGWRFVGRRFVAYSLWGMAIYSLALSLIDWEIPIQDPMLAAVMAGAVSGLGAAVILKSYGSSGGSDILCVIMNKLFAITLGTGSMLINSAVLALAALLFPIDKVLYTLVFVFVSKQVTDEVFHGLAKRRTALIISDQWKAITETLTSSHRFGVTLLHGQGGFQGTERPLLYSVVPRRSVSTLKRVSSEIDPNVFIAIMEADDVTGVEVGNQPHW